MADDDAILEEARARHRRCEDDESQARNRYREDMKFGEADSDNGWQWDQRIRASRELDARPCLTVNKTRQHCLQIINDARQNKPQIRIQPVGDGATKEAADVFEGIVRHIEYISQAQAAYDTATYHQVYGGWGYVRVLRDYASDNSFDQELFIRRVGDPLSVYLDPDIQQYDGSDANFGLVFRDMPAKDFDREYPEHKGKISPHASFDENDNRRDWCGKDHVRVAEYYRRVKKSDKLVALPQGVAMPDGRVTALRSELPDDVFEALGDVATRDVTTNKVEWFLIAGDRIIDRRDEPGQYIPIARVIGEETRIEGQLDRKGHVRALKDAQRMLNYWTSSAVEHVALQGKTPWVGSARHFEGIGEWETANQINHAYLTYNDVDTQTGEAIPGKPERPPPPSMSAAYLQGRQMAEDDLRLVSGQYQAEMGAPGNERSGVAIQQRQRQADNATYHYVDHLAQAVRFLGRILVDLIPHVYDTPRVLRILGEDGTEDHVQLDPNARQALQDGGQEQQTQQEQAEFTAGQVQRIFNPKVGRYSVEADIGPAFATRRQEAFNALSQIMQRAPDIAAKAGDILFRAADFPMADKIAERLERSVPAALRGEGPPPELQQAMAHIKQLETQLQMAMQAHQVMQQKLEARDQRAGADDAADRARAGIDVYKAETARIQALAATLDPQSRAMLVQQLVGDVMADGQLQAAPMPQLMPPGVPALPPGGMPPGVPLQ